jgi:type IV pilus assembly protein PilE
MPQAFARLQVALNVRSARAKARGFTLIEVMVVVAIIGILAAIAIRSRLVEATNALSDMRTKMEQSYADNRSYGSPACGVPMPTLDDFALTCSTSAAGQAYSIVALGKATSSVKNFQYTLTNANVRTTTWGDAWGNTQPAGGTTRWVMRK